MHILIVDDEPSIITLLTQTLNQVDYQVDTAIDGKEAYNKVVANVYDFIILDVMLPHMSGLDICRRARDKGIQTPILLLTARGDEYDKVIGLELGADDYMTKPFSPNEILARINAIMRRYQRINKSADNLRMTPDNRIQPISNRLTFGKIQIDMDRIEVYIKNKKIALTPKEFDLLLYLCQNQGKTLSREQLLDKVWQFDYLGETRIVDVHISHLREKIEANPKNPEYITTIRGFGYRFEVPNEA